jgi:hypothetical protein
MEEKKRMKKDLLKYNPSSWKSLWKMTINCGAYNFSFHIIKF